METNRLRQFCAVVETGNLRKAAGLLGISHSGLSKSMRVLEGEVGAALLVPSGRGITVTDHGRALFARCPPFFAGLEQLLGGRAPAKAEPVRLGSFEVFTSYFIGQLVHEHLRDAEVEVHELAPGRLEEALLLAQIDVGITYEPIPREGIEYVQVAQVQMGAFALARAFSKVSLTEVPFVAPVKPLEGAPTGVRGLDAWPEVVPRQVRYRVDLMTTGLELVHRGLCAIFIPRFVARLHDEAVRPSLALEELALPKGVEPIVRPVYLVKRESTPESPVLRKIARALRKLQRE